MCIKSINNIKIMKNININEHSVFCYRRYYRKCNENMNNLFNVKCDIRENEKLNGNKFPRFLVSYFYVLRIVGIIYCLLFNIHTDDNKNEGVVTTWSIHSRCLSEGYYNLYCPLANSNAYFSFREVLHGSNHYIPKEFMEWDDEEEENSLMFHCEDDDCEDDDEDDVEDEDEDDEDIKKINHKNVANKTNMEKTNNINKTSDNKNNHSKNKVQQEQKKKNTSNQKKDANNKCSEDIKKKVKDEEKHKKENNANEKVNNDNNKNKKEKKNEKENQGNNKDLPAYKTIDYNNLSVQICLDDFHAVLNSLDSVLSTKEEMLNLWNQLRGIERSLFEDTLSDLFTFYHALSETYNFTPQETEHIWKKCLSDAHHSENYAETKCNVDYGNFIKKKKLTLEEYKNYLTQNMEQFSKLRDEIHYKGKTYLNEQFDKYCKEKNNNLDQDSKKKKKENEKERKGKEKEQEKKKKKKEQEKENKNNSKNIKQIHYKLNNK
ncbi:Plasmodium exported protein (PHISTb), unknown function [Plasmodium sp. DRC-Itaito]|nr:Plasmodium exported protein (PHISTb), unknown function [Plasmodium sp. DRC-Itaito]